MTIDLAKLVKGAATSRTVYGGLSLFGMLAGNVRFQGTLWIDTTPIPLTDANIVVALAGLLLVLWGRAKAAGPLVVDKQPQPAAENEAEPKGFPRA